MRPTSPWRSLRVRLPGGIVLILTLALGAFAAFAEREVETALMAVADARLNNASAELSDLLSQAMDTQSGALADVARRDEVVDFMRGGAPDPASVTPLLDSLAAAGNGGRAAALATRQGLLAWSGDSTLTAVARAAEAGRVGPLLPWADHVAYGFAVPVLDGADTLGYLLEARSVAPNPTGAQSLANLVGSRATFALGRVGGPWTDLASLVDGPFEETEVGVVEQFTDAGGRPMLGRTTTMGASPWLVWVALPRATFLDPQRAFVSRTAWVGALLLVLGAAGGWMLSGSITGRLSKLTGTAEAIMGGDYSRRFGGRGDDEVGRLGRAFDGMAEQVEASHELLEERVRARTEELELALVKLEEAQAELVRKERLALLGELAGGVGHELRNPLGVMTNAVYYLDAVLTDRPAKIDEYLGILRSQITASEKIVGNLLDFARLNTPERATVHLPTLIAEQLTRTPGIERVAVRLDLPDDLPGAFVDGQQIGQIVQNLLLNAAQAMVDDDEPVITVGGTSVGDRVRITVADSGPGITPEVLKKVFEPLFTTKARGIGLGLSVCQSLARANGGTLAVRSEPGEGATFVLELPTEEDTA